jgi:hypothetical protein
MERIQKRRGQGNKRNKGKKTEKYFRMENAIMSNICTYV